jgi:hypothetical protein
MLTNTIESITLQTYMNTHNFHITSIESITCNNTQTNHIWTNALTQQCHVGSTQAYWIDHNPVYFAFKLLDYVPQFVIPSINEKNLDKKIDFKLVSMKVKSFSTITKLSCYRSFGIL